MKKYCLFIILFFVSCGTNKYHVQLANCSIYDLGNICIGTLIENDCFDLKSSELSTIHMYKTKYVLVDLDLFTEYVHIYVTQIASNGGTEFVLYDYSLQVDDEIFEDQINVYIFENSDGADDRMVSLSSY